MVDLSKVTSGFDVELVMGEEFIRYSLLAALETSSIPWWSESQGINRDGVPYHLATLIHPPAELRERRLYEVNPAFEGLEHPFQDVVGTVYSAQAEEFRVTIQPDDATGVDLLVRVLPSLIDLQGPTPTVLVENRVPIDLHIGFDIVFDTRSDGLLGNIGLQLTLVDVSGPLVDAAVALGNDRETILADLKRVIDRRVPFALAGGGALQRVATRKLLDDTQGPRGIGVYINLALRTGGAATDLVPDRGDVALAQNLLATADTTMAFAFSADLYARLADDFKWKLAVPKPDEPGAFHFPLMDGDTQIGTIKGVSVYAERTLPPGQPPRFTDVLVIDIHGEYAIDNFFDPDFHLRLRLVPRLGPDNRLDFDVDFDLSFSPAAQILMVFFTVALSFLLPKLGLSLLFLSMLAVKIIERVGESAAGAALQAELDRTSFLDTLPHKLVVEQRRWDPLYHTLHRIEIGDASMRCDDRGFAFDSGRLFVGRKTVPLATMVIRSETRDAAGVVDGLVYRAGGIGPVLETDLVFDFPATDRMPHGALLAPQGDIETHRVILTLQQIDDRVAAGDRHVTGIDYRPKRVAVKGNQILRLMAVSDLEIAEVAARVRALAANDASVNVDARLEQELDARMTLDLEPHEFAALQRQRKLLVLGRNHLVIRTMRKRGGGTVTYYRDYERPFEPDTDRRDNLMALPRYRSVD